MSPSDGLAVANRAAHDRHLPRWSKVTNPFSNASLQPLATGVSAPVTPSAPGDWLAPSGNDARVAIVLVAATLLYLAYHLAIAPAVVTRLFPERTTTEPELRTTVAFFRKAVGSALFGVLPAIAIAAAWPGGLAACGLSLVEAPLTLLLASRSSRMTVPRSLMQSRKPSFRQHYPEVRAPSSVSWPRTTRRLGRLSRRLRVLLPRRARARPGAWGGRPPASLDACRLMAYVFAHFGRYPGEVIGTLVTGTAFGIVALATGSILMPIVAHLGVALLSDHLAGRPVSDARR